MNKDLINEVSLKLDSKNGKFVFSEGFDHPIPCMELSMLSVLISNAYDRAAKPILEMFNECLPEFFDEKISFEKAFDKFIRKLSMCGFGVNDTTRRIKILDKSIKEECKASYEKYFNEQTVSKQ